MSQGRRFLIGGMVALVSMLMLSMVMLWAYREVNIGLEAEKTLHAYRLVMGILTFYVEQNAEWPHTWEDLLSVIPSDRDPVFEWPRDNIEIRRRVRIDFDVALADVSAMTLDDFSAVQQLGPNYGPSERQVERLLRTVKVATEK